MDDQPEIQPDAPVVPETPVTPRRISHGRLG
jgi:hypothetical protein